MEGRRIQAGIYLASRVQIDFNSLDLTTLVLRLERN